MKNDRSFQEDNAKQQSYDVISNTYWMRRIQTRTLERCRECFRDHRFLASPKILYAIMKTFSFARLLIWSMQELYSRKPLRPSVSFGYLYLFMLFNAFCTTNEWINAEWFFQCNISRSHVHPVDSSLSLLLFQPQFWADSKLNSHTHKRQLHYSVWWARDTFLRQ